MTNSIKAGCVAVVLAMQLLGATAARATDQDVQPVDSPDLHGAVAVASHGSGSSSNTPGVFDQVNPMSFGNLGLDRQAERIRNQEDVGEQDHGLEAGLSDRLGAW